MGPITLSLTKSWLVSYWCIHLSLDTLFMGSTWPIPLTNRFEYVYKRSPLKFYFIKKKNDIACLWSDSIINHAHFNHILISTSLTFGNLWVVPSHSFTNLPYIQSFFFYKFNQIDLLYIVRWLTLITFVTFRTHR